MGKDPAFLFYSSDFLTGVSDLTMKERGQYITLLCLQHQKGRLSKKMIDIAAADATADVLHKFSIDENGLYFNKRLEAEIEKRAEHSKKQRDRAIKGWKKRRKKDAPAHAAANATALPLENENENINEDENENIEKGGMGEKTLTYPFDTETFKQQWQQWKIYKKAEFNFKYKSIQSEQAGLNKISKLSEGNQETAIAIMHQSMENGWKGFFKLKIDDKKDNQKGGVSDEYRRKVAQGLGII